MAPVTILVWNCRGIRNKKEELAMRIGNYDIAVITETKQPKNAPIYFTGYKTYRTDNLDSKGGIAMVIHNRLEFDILKCQKDTHESVERLDITIKNFSEKVNIVAVYRRPGIRLSKSTWRKIFTNNENTYKTYYVGDFNAHNTIWNCGDTDRNGENMCEIMCERDLVCYNEDTKSRMVTGLLGLRLLPNYNGL
ncbi:uncharacterized protein LOC105424011 isoform X2 [Pogonomyrmex barbatus]|uniref:Uncharacterized protein LOC105424011 isoform X2 n=1 Tax=Pogonomyrmex barbatus TaxID=144034 RepID=A0A6I9WKP9_9HYME|nr:uncharacterized protein LOC105424011 isoform X2 [Pogonomyrmex barbatus]